MNLLGKTLACSGLLAARQQTVVPDLPLAWNPRDAVSTICAAGEFLSHIAQYVFPVANGVMDLDTALEYLTYIPLIGQGFNYWYESPFNELFPGIHRLLVTFLTLENCLDNDHESAYAAYTELRDLGFDDMVPLFKMYGWLEACISGKRPFPDDLLKEGKAHEQGFAFLMRYLSNDTGYELLDWSEEEEEEDLFLEMELDWSDIELVERHRTGWIQAQIIREQINLFSSWSQNSWENYLRVQEVMIMLCREVKREWGAWGEQSAWEMTTMREAYADLMQHLGQQYDGWYEDEEE